MALLASRTRVELREIKLSAKPAAMLSASPKATVPVLVLPGGVVIDESLAIMRWALALDDPLHWLAGGDDGLIAINDGDFKTHLDRYKYPQRHGSDAVAHRNAGLTILEALELRLGAQPQLCGAAVTLTDIATFPFVRQFAATDAGWFAAQPLPAVQRWLSEHAASPLFDAAMLRLPAWQAGDAPVYFGAQS